MTRGAKLAAAGGAIVAAGVLASGGYVAARSTSSSSLSSSTVPVPANLEVLSVGQTAIKLGWGPTLPGELKAGKATGTSLVVTWGASRDDNHGPVTYSVSKNGTRINQGLTVTQIKVGFTRAVRTFRMCVWAINAIGKSGPPMCSTFNGA